MPPTIGNIELVIFDCDGVLVDSELISARILINALATVGVHVDLAHVKRHFIGRSWNKVAAEVRHSHGLLLGSDFEELYRRNLMEAFRDELKPVVGVEAVLTQLAVTACVATSSSQARAERSLQMTGLARYFEGRLFTASMVANGKPAPDLFLHAADMMGVAARRCLVIEDSSPGVEAGLAAGMQVLRFAGGSHLREDGNAASFALKGVATFDCWGHFFALAPGLERKGGNKGASQDSNG